MDLWSFDNFNYMHSFYIILSNGVIALMHWYSIHSIDTAVEAIQVETIQVTAAEALLDEVI